MYATDVIRTLEQQADPARAQGSSRFFKTGPGQYGEGDQFFGVSVPAQRLVAKQYKDLPLAECVKLLRVPYHECRLTALFILVGQSERASQSGKKMIMDLYLSNTKYINNWDLVDSSAGYIIGPLIVDGDYTLLTRLARSENLWERRIAMLACFNNIKQGNPEPAFTIIELLKYDKHDLIQKAVGWMLREIGKRCSRQTLLDWLLNDDQYKKLPRTTLRYAIEHFDADDRHRFLRGQA